MRCRSSVVARRLAVSTVLASGMLLLAAPGSAQAVPDILPLNGTVVPGAQLAAAVVVNGGAASATIAPSGTDLAIGLTAPTTVINWGSYAIGAQNSVSYSALAGSNARTVLNRVIGTGADIAPSVLAGKLTAPGLNFWLINPAGILVGGDAAISTGSFYASTLDICGDPLCAAAADATAIAGFVAGGAVRLARRTGFTATPLQGVAAEGITVLPSTAGRGIATTTGPLVLVSGAIATGGSLSSAGDIALVTASDVSFADPASPLAFTIAAGTAMRFVAEGSSVISGRHVTIAAAGRDSLSAVLLNVGGKVTATSATVTDQGIVLSAALAPDARAADRAGVAVAGQLTSASGIAITGDSIAGSGAGGLSAGGQVALTAHRGDVGYLADIAGGDVAIGAVLGTASIAGNVTSTGAYAVTAGAAVLGTSTASRQQAAGLVRVATDDGISGGPGLTLLSNSGGAADPADARALSLSTGGAITFAPGSTLLGGVGKQSLVRIATGGAVSLGAVTARSIAGLAAAKLTTRGDITARGAVDVAAALDIETTAGSITTGAVTVEGAALALTLKASRAIQATALTSSGDATLVAGTTVTGTTLDAQGGTASIAAASVDFDRVGAGTDAVVDAGSIRVGQATAGGDIRLSATGADATTAALRLGSAGAGRNVALRADAGTVAVTGDVTAGTGDYTVDGRAAVLGSTVASTQRAAGLVRVTATAGGISGGSGLTVQSNRNGAVDPLDARALSLAATGGAIDLAAGSLLLGGTAKQSPVRIGTGGAASLGAVTARALTGLTAAGDIVVRGAVDVDSALTIESSAGSITTAGPVKVGGANQALTLAAARAVQSATLASSGGATIVAGTSASGATLDARGAASIMAGSVDFDRVAAGADATIGAATIRLGAATAGDDLRLIATGADGAAGSALRLGSAGAGRDIALRADAGSVAVTGAVTAANDLAVFGRAIDAAGQALAATRGALSLTANPGAAGAGGIALGTGVAGTTATLTAAGPRGDVIVTTLDGRTGVAVTSGSGNVRVGSAASGSGDVLLSALRGQATGMETGPGVPSGAVLAAGRSVTVAAGALAQVETVTAAQDATIVAGSRADGLDGAIVAGTVDAAAGALTLRGYHGAAAGAAGVTLGSGTAGTTASIEANGRGDVRIATLLDSGRAAAVRTEAGSIRAALVRSRTGDVTLSATGGDVTGVDAAAGYGRAIAAADGSVSVVASDGIAKLAAVTAGRDVTINARGVDADGATARAGGVQVDARAGDIALGSAAASRDVRLAAARDATVRGDVAAGRDYAITAGRDALLGGGAAATTQSARGAVAVLAARDVVGGTGLTLRANDDGAGGEALSIQATSGKVRFAGGSQLLGGVGDGASDVLIRTAQRATFGTATAGHDLTVDAVAVAGQAATAQAGRLAIDARGGDIALGSAGAAGGVRLTAVAGALGNGDVRLAQASSGGEVAVTAAADAIVSGDVIAGGTYSVTAGRDALLGDGATATTQSARGAVSVLAARDVAGGTGLTLRANDDGVGGEALSIQSTSGEVRLAGGSQLLGGVGDGASDVLIRAAQRATFGTATAGRDLTVDAGTVAGQVATAERGNLTLDARVGDMQLAQASAGGSVALSAAGDATVSGDVAAGGSYSVAAGRDALLGDGAAATTQSARGAVGVLAARDVLGGAGLTLRANDDGAGGEALSIQASGGEVRFAGGSQLLGGTGGAASDVLIRAAQHATFGTAAAAHDLTVDAGAVAGRAATAQAGSLAIDARGGDIALASAGAADGVRLTAVAGALGSGDVRLTQASAGSDVALAAAADVGVSGDVAAGGSYAVAAGGTVRLGDGGVAATQTAAGSVTLLAGGDVLGAAGLTLRANGDDAGGEALSIGATGGRVLLAADSRAQAGAGSDVLVGAAGPAQLGTLTAGRDIRVDAGSVAADAASFTAQTGSATIDARGGDIRVGQVAAGPGGAGSADVRLTAVGGALGAGDIAIGRATASRDVTLTGTRDVAVRNDVAAGRDYGVTAGGGATLGEGGAATQAAGGGVSVVAGNVAGGAGLVLRANADASGGEGLVIRSTDGEVRLAYDGAVVGGIADAGSDVLIQAAARATLGTVTAGRDVTVDAGAVAAAGRTVTAQAGTVRIAARAGDIVLGSANAGIASPQAADVLLTAAKGGILLGSASASRNVALAAAGDATVAHDVAAGADYLVTAGGSALLGDDAGAETQRAGGRLSVAAEGGVRGGDLLTLRSGSGALTLRSTRGDIVFAPAATIQGGTDAAGQDVRIVADAGNVLLDGTVTAGLASVGGSASLTVSAARGTVGLGTSGAGGVTQQAGGAIAIAAGGTITGGGDAGATDDSGVVTPASALLLRSGSGTVTIRSADGDVNFGRSSVIQGGGDASGSDVDIAALGATGGRASLGTVLAAGRTIAVHARDVTLRGVAGRTRSIDAGSGAIRLFNQSRSVNPTRLGTAATDSGGFSLSQAEFDRLRAATLYVGAGSDDATLAAADRGAMQDVAIGTLALGSDAGSATAAFLATAAGAAGPGSITLDGVLTAAGSPATRTIRFGGGPDASAAGRAATIQLITDGHDRSTGQIDVADGTLDLRGFRIVAGRSGFAKAVLAAPDRVAADFIARPTSLLYNAAATLATERYDPAVPALIVNAGRLTARFTDFALFQNTGLFGATTGVRITGPASATASPLQLIAPGSQLANGFAVFGTVTQGDGGTPGTATALLGSAYIGIVDVNGGNARVNGCLVGSASGGCLATAFGQPTLNVFDVSRAQILSAGDELPVSFDPLVGNNNDALFGDLDAGDPPFQQEPCPEGTVSPACREGTR